DNDQDAAQTQTLSEFLQIAGVIFDVMPRVHDQHDVSLVRLESWRIGRRPAGFDFASFLSSFAGFDVIEKALINVDRDNLPPSLGDRKRKIASTSADVRHRLAHERT